MVYVSITGLRVRSWLREPQFWFHAVPCLIAARRAPGNLSAEARIIAGVRHTLSAWESRDHMMDFVHSGVHERAIRAFNAIATGETIGFETDQVPDWAAARAIWEERGRTY